MPKKPFRNIHSQLFDIRPTRKDGKIDFVKILSVREEVNLRISELGSLGSRETRARSGRRIFVRDAGAFEERRFAKSREQERIKLPTREELLAELERVGEPTPKKVIEERELSVPRVHARFSFPRISLNVPVIPDHMLGRAVFTFSAFFLIFSLGVLSTAFIQKATSTRANVTEYGLRAYGHLDEAKTHALGWKFFAASKSFADAGREFGKARGSLGKLTGTAIDFLDFLPFGRSISSGNNLLRAGGALSRAGEHITYGMGRFESAIPVLDSRESLPDAGDFPTDRLIIAREEIRIARTYLEEARIALDGVRIESLPDEIQPQVSDFKEKLPILISSVDSFLSHSDTFLLFLGHDNPRTYLLLFQNPGEIRATGGFIGSYGLLEIDRGIIRKFVVDDIYNLDGQLFEKVIPPRPIQSISTAWSTHDANWFLDFPESARHVLYFFEKAGGPTPDGVITLNTNVLRKLVRLTGPIPLPDHGITLDSSNIVEELQEEIEVTYDAHLNQPKKILTDLGPLLLSEIGDAISQKSSELGGVFLSSLEEKDILIYSRDSRVEELILDLGWGGNVVDTPKDYLAVVHSNINGFKTDWVIDEDILHTAEISAEGDVIDTVTIIRKHRGGSKEFYKKVNKDYLRVYVPKGSELLEASGYTAEEYKPPIDYEKSKFVRDSVIETIENTFHEDPTTGTHIFEESGKTVFGNWVFVSPGETVIVTYRYRLPFRLRFDGYEDSYSMYIQKQPSMNQNIKTSIKLPYSISVAWKYPEDVRDENGVLVREGVLAKDMLVGVILKK